MCSSFYSHVYSSGWSWSWLGWSWSQLHSNLYNFCIRIYIVFCIPPTADTLGVLISLNKAGSFGRLVLRKHTFVALSLLGWAGLGLVWVGLGWAGPAPSWSWSWSCLVLVLVLGPADPGAWLVPCICNRFRICVCSCVSSYVCSDLYSCLYT